MKGSDTTEELTSSNALKFRHPGGLGSWGIQAKEQEIARSLDLSDLISSAVAALVWFSACRWELKRLTKEVAEGEDPIDDDADMEAGT